MGIDELEVNSYLKDSTADIWSFEGFLVHSGDKALETCRQYFISDLNVIGNAFPGLKRRLRSLQESATKVKTNPLSRPARLVVTGNNNNVIAQSTNVSIKRKEDEAGVASSTRHIKLQKANDFFSESEESNDEEDLEVQQAQTFDTSRNFAENVNTRMGSHSMVLIILINSKASSWTLIRI
ncbi:hypothetical protein HMPREF1544_11188 [Mucor circinelloides 1006PhL]|uniref:Uncharacterized protein n=1 Tax=Mucor circinelloides f. circinelloides (strain 1006PhL) TaxID=1220926 RepID=S2JQL2_MUCC1|nr:hypothetical protein HMPREF1544_11188 [Mucor circinelloides 1006PhL]KAG1085173.1 hypothetical protein G6F42_021500 [Rhizopus arrhizus]